MKTKLIFFYFPLFLLCCSVRPEDHQYSKKRELNYETKHFTQILDHFNYNPQSYQTFQQRYLLNDEYWGGTKNNAPIFVYIGDEADIEFIIRNIGFMFDLAPHFTALLLFIEVYPFF
ncbi:hypothetical protein P3S67_000015 [Capsicum chacoense]